MKLEASPKSRPGGRSKRVSEAVKQATIGILVESGASELTLEAVAAKAGVNRTTLYRRWGDKMRLITWALLETVGEEVPYVDKGSLKADLTIVLTGVNEFLSTALAKSILQIMAQKSDASDDVNQALVEFWDSRLNRMGELF
jgi:AcrR family transcriptional regulator